MKLDIYKCFIPECYLDTALVEVLLNKSNAVNHGKGNSSVAAKMKQPKMADSFVVGIIDEDKIKLRALEEFKMETGLNKQQLKFFRHPVKKHYFIQICPAIEKWILTECTKAGISLKDYDLPDDERRMAKLKSSTQRDDIRFKRLFREMVLNDKCDEVQEMLKWLTYLKEKNYHADINELING